jgi:hypothetical protein
MVPLQTCKPLSIVAFYENSTYAGNTTFSFPNLDNIDDNCHTLKYFINASVASMFFAGVAILMFICFDMLSKCNSGHFSRASVQGMSNFLIFLLIQTAACSYAIYNECQYWVTFYEERFAELEEAQIDEVRTYGNEFLFFMTSIVAVACAGLLFIDFILGFFVGMIPTKDNKKAKESESYAASPVDTMENDAVPNEYPEQSTNTPNSRSWTTY